jgi:UDP-N-acetylglucosamine diphosphorylase/glucosamine-1-phosphate N-acetyltransferase
MEQRPVIIIMAGGLGKRMNSDIPKVLHKIHGKPMLVHVVETALKLNPIKILIVVGKYRAVIEETLLDYISTYDIENITFVLQDEPLGTGHAIQCCSKELYTYMDRSVIILSGDTPLLQASTIEDIIYLDITNHNKKFVKIVATIMENPYGYGRILQDESGNFKCIVEDKDASFKEKETKLVNCGIYLFSASLLCKYLPFLDNNNAQGEYYLTDLIGLIKYNEEKIEIGLYEIPLERQIEIFGVNTIEQLEHLSKL